MRRPDAQLFHRPARLHDLHGLIVERQNLVRVGNQPHAVGGHRFLTALLFEQCTPHLLFESLHLLGDRGLRASHARGGRRKGLVLRYRHESAQQIDIQISHGFWVDTSGWLMCSR